MAQSGNLRFGVAIVLIVAAVGGAYVWILAPDVEPLSEVTNQPVAASAPAAAALRLVQASGDVERRAGDGAWTPIAVGAQVGLGDDLRTSEGGRAELALGDDLQVQLATGSRVRLVRESDGAARVVVGEGLAVVDVRPESGRLVRIVAEGSDAVTETRDGKVHVLNDGSGSVSTAVVRGKASVTAQGKVVELTEGLATQVKPGAAPTNPAPVPTSLLLKVKWPTAGPTNKRRHLIRGTATPGARVRVGETVVTANAAGDFEAIIELADGNNRVRVRALDVLGSSAAEESPPIEVDTKAPTHRIKTGPDLWKRP